MPACPVALRLVELTYPAIAAALGDGDRAGLSESWAQQRSVSVRDFLLQLVGPGAALSSDDLAMVLQQRSGARRAVRLRVFEVDEANRIVERLTDSGKLPEDAEDLLVPDYDPTVKGYQRARGFRVPMEIVKILHEHQASPVS